MTGNLIFRLERLEQIERDQPKPGPLAALSDDELSVNLLETCAGIVASDCTAEYHAYAIATAERIQSEIDGWAVFWKSGGWNGQAGDRLRPLTGNGIGETERDRARHGEMHYRASAALKQLQAATPAGKELVSRQAE